MDSTRLCLGIGCPSDPKVPSTAASLARAAPGPLRAGPVAEASECAATEAEPAELDLPLLEEAEEEAEADAEAEVEAEDFEEPCDVTAAAAAFFLLSVLFLFREALEAPPPPLPDGDDVGIAWYAFSLTISPVDTS